MFRKLEAFANPQNEFVASQQQLFNTDPYRIPSATSGLPGFANAIRTPTTYNTIYKPTSTEKSKEYQPDIIPSPDSIFQQMPSVSLSQMAATCASGSIDDLIRNKTTDRVGCGWVYTPPNPNSPYPVVDRGALGDRNGPYDGFDAPSHKKWFFDLQEAKKQKLMDKCKSLQSCANIDSAVYNGKCGFCTDTNQGIPIHADGTPMYGNDPRGNCTATSIVTSKGNCPVPNTEGPQPVRDRTCEPINGRLSLGCLHRSVLSGGCDRKGALAIALSGSQPSVTNLANSASVKLYNRFAQPPLDMNLFTGANTTVDTVINATRQISANTAQPTTGLGMAARDLCFQRGASDSYDECNELTDNAVGPFNVKCLQGVFLKMGGIAQGSVYPSQSNIGTYNSMGSLAKIKQYWTKMLANAKGKDGFIDVKDTFIDANEDGYVNYTEQDNAMQAMYGIKLEDAITRAPYSQGVEVFWFFPAINNPNGIAGFLKRTIETNIVSFSNLSYHTPQIAGIGYGAMLQMTDVRSKTEFSVQFRVVVDDGFWVAVNQPAAIDEQAMNQYSADQPGLFENLGLQGPTPYQSRAVTPFSGDKPNIMKLYHEDAGGGWSAFQFSTIPVSGTPLMNSQYLSLTCEARAPFLQYEVSKRGKFEELRNPGIFSKFLGMGGGLIGLDFHLRAEEKAGVPGKKSFVRMNSANSRIDLPNIAFQSWKTMTVAIRFNTMPVKETIMCLACGGAFNYFNVITTPINGSSAKIFVECNIGRGMQTIDTYRSMDLNVWYLFRIDNLGNGFNFTFDRIDSIIQNQGRLPQPVNASGSQLWGANKIWNNGEPCTIMFSTNGFMSWRSYYSSSSFNYDLAWIHWFDGSVNENDMYREALANWKYTEFAKAYNTY
jgi:hypothetical protein